jgi:protein-S-isoprenylcysteine O-methyltransferase Ste14
MSKKELPASGNPWWRGARGEWWVAAQFPLLALAFALPHRLPPAPPWPPGTGAARDAAGVLLLAAGGVLFAAGVFRLGRNLTPLPRPRDTAALVTTGVYAVVRHPLYGGVVLASLGNVLRGPSPLALLLALLVFVFFDRKASREEAWLAERFPDYAVYRRRVKKFIPWLY